MTSPDAFELQRLLKQAKNEWCEIAIIETASHWIKMNRVWWIEYDIAVLTNITQDHLDLHKTMKDYVNTKLKLFKNLITSKRKPWVKKVAVINKESEYADLFLDETYNSLYTYWKNRWADLIAKNINDDWVFTSFEVDVAWPNINIKTKLKWDFNIQNILAAIWVLISLKIKPEQIAEVINKVDWVPWRMENIENDEWFNIIVDYAHTEDALEKVLETIKWFKNIWKIITVFWATWDRDKSKRFNMWKIVSENSDIVILTQDDDYSEKTESIMNDVIPWINRKQWEDFWVITTRKEAIQTALFMAKKWDVILIAWKWDEHVMITNEWPIKWHDKTIVKQLLKSIDDNKIIKE
jgi:UDP-N-acetylmuramyl-tripeptide synthetase